VYRIGTELDAAPVGVRLDEFTAGAWSVRCRIGTELDTSTIGRD
jgi:hypothetical protein